MKRFSRTAATTERGAEGQGARRNGKKRWCGSANEDGAQENQDENGWMLTERKRGIRRDRPRISKEAETKLLAKLISH